MGSQRSDLAQARTVHTLKLYLILCVLLYQVALGMALALPLTLGCTVGTLARLTLASTKGYWTGTGGSNAKEHTDRLKIVTRGIAQDQGVS